MVLRLNKGWHVNANSVSFEGMSAAREVYPMSVRLKSTFDPDGREKPLMW